MPYYQGGWNIDYLTRSKVLIVNPWEDPERKPLRTNLEILEWSSIDLMDQVGSYKQGFGVLWPWPVQGVTASFFNRPVCIDRATASFWKWGIYTPQPSPSRVAASLAFLSFPKLFSWPASSPQHSLWVEPTRFHILWLGWEIERVWDCWALWELRFEQQRATIAWALVIRRRIQDCICYSWSFGLLNG